MIKSKKIHLFIFLSSVIIYSITAYFSVGYYYFDEHYQILEFANIKLGLTETESLPWEYAAKIRPSIQPLIYVAIYKIV